MQTQCSRFKFFKKKIMSVIVLQSIICSIQSYRRWNSVLFVGSFKKIVKARHLNYYALVSITRHKIIIKTRYFYKHLMF